MIVIVFSHRRNIANETRLVHQQQKARYGTLKQAIATLIEFALPFRASLPDSSVPVCLLKPSLEELYEAWRDEPREAARLLDWIGSPEMRRTLQDDGPDKEPRLL